MAIVHCARCGQDRDQMAFRPFPNDQGLRVFNHICAVCWGEWLTTQKQMINHYALNLQDPKSKELLLREMEKFLFTTSPQS